MTNDSKLGLLAGVAAVIVAAVVYYQKPQVNAATPIAGDLVGTPGAPPSVPPAAVIVPQKAGKVK
jgi:hypothetical protein